MKRSVLSPFRDEALREMRAALATQAVSILVLPNGDGKTLVADEIVRDFAKTGRTALWLAVSWERLFQTAFAYSKRFDGVKGLARIAGPRSPLKKLLRDDLEGTLQFTSLHTWHYRRDREQLSPGRINLLVIDECDWGIKGTMGRALMDTYQGRVPILGLSTPKRRVVVPGEARSQLPGDRKRFDVLQDTLPDTSIPADKTPRSRVVSIRNNLFRRRNALSTKLARRPFRSHRRPPTVHKAPPREQRFERLVAPADIAGLPFALHQTFGVEVEFTSPFGHPNNTGLEFSEPKWKAIARTIIRAIEGVASLPVDTEPRNYHQVRETDRWRVEFDRSAGWEVVSPILSNQEGFLELANVLSALNDLCQESKHLHINHRTGLHLTLGSGFTDDRQVKGLVRLCQVLEPGLFTLVSPSRLYRFQNGDYSLKRNNKYCLPLRNLDLGVDHLGLASFGERDPAIRYRTVNLSNVGEEDQHIEIRLHNGTTEYQVIVAWISLWMTIFNRARSYWPRDGNTSRIFPRGNAAIDSEQACSEDLFTLLRRVDVLVDPLLRIDLARRRQQLLESWEKVIPERVNSWRRWWTPYY